MSQALASLEAVGRYLETAGNFAGLSEAKGSHISFLTSQFARHTWTVTEAAEVLNLLQRQGVWSQVEKDSLANAVQNGVAARSSVLSRQIMQDYNVILYIPDSMWSQLMDRNLTFQAKASLIGNFATKLGLRAPSESTSQMITSLLLACPGGRDLESHSALEPQQLHQLFLLVKKEIKATISVAPPAEGFPHVEKLPTQPQQLDPQWLQKGLGHEAIGQCPLSVSQVAARAVTIPMRSTNKNLVESKKPSRACDMMLSHLMNGLQIPSPQLAQAALPAPPATRQPAASTPCPLPLAAPSAAPYPTACASTAVVTPHQSAEMQTGGTSVSKQPQPQSVVSAAAMLQQQWQEAKETNQENSEEVDKVEQKACGKKTSKESKVKNKEKATKTDTSKVKSKQSSKVVKTKEKKKCIQDDFQLRRKAGVPLALLKKHEFGCGRCRNRPYCTRSCWSLRGFSIWKPNGAIECIWPEFAMRFVTQFHYLHSANS